MNARCTALLREALDLPESKRRAFLEQASAGDAALLSTLLHLLELDADSDPLLDAPLDGVVADLLADDADATDEVDDVAAGDRIGPWQIISKLGAGGMGSVWLAERADGVYLQKVALKTIKPGMDSARVLAQFRRERALLARLKHPNIASLIDGGVDQRGRPWFAMDHVQGLGLRAWIDQQPALEDRLRLFEKLCRAVAHAHQQLVIHRDIKPGNVLVQADDEPKLLDFGIAKLLVDDDGEQTLTVQRFASRSYAAPEQLRGEAVTTATDVYALGALLFEMLTGTRYASVHAGEDAPTPASRIAGQDSAARSVPATLLRGDLDAIVTRALAVEPERRYATALSLAEDVHDHLAGKPISARPDGFAYRTSKFIRRHRVSVAIACIGLLGLLATSGVALWQARAKTAEAARTQVALQRSEAIRGFIESVFLDADPSRARGENTTAGELLEAARARVASDLGDQPDIAATMLNQIGNVYVSLGKDEVASEILHEALAMNARATQPSLSVEALAGGRLAYYDFVGGNAELALQKLERIITSVRPRQELAGELSKSLQLKGTVLHAIGRNEEGLAASAEAASVLATHADTLAAEYGIALVVYADAAAGAGQGLPALQAVERALALPLVRDHGAPALELAVLGAKVRALQALQRDAEAEPILGEVIEASSKLYGANSARTRYWVYRQAQILHKLGRLDQGQARVDGLLAQPASDTEQPIARSAFALTAAEIAILRHSPDAPARIAQAQAIACSTGGNASFCERSRALKSSAD